MSPPWRRLARLRAHIDAAGTAGVARATSFRAGRAAGRPFRKVLIANRGVAAIRVAHAAAELGITSAAVYDAEEDALALHRRLCDEAVALERRGDLAPYLDASAIVEAALRVGADCCHPGYGFLAESADLARQCEAAGITFIGPPVQALEAFGSKTRARALAASLEPPVPTLAGSSTAFMSGEDAAAFLESSSLIGKPVMLKAAHGGGGRGMRRIPAGTSREDFLEAFRRAQSEAVGAFGEAGVFVEELLERCRHIEVQVFADASGKVAHLFERDCSVQLGRGVKVVEVCPAPKLAEDVRERILEDAVRLISATPGGYRNAGTVEFLLEICEDGTAGKHVFIEVNPRLQVEHGITEEACGVDVVRAQFHLAAGSGLRESLGLDPEDPQPSGSHGLVPAPRRWAVEARVCLTSPPQSAISGYREPGGRGVRLEAAVHAGCRPSARYDPLLALVIGSGESLELALTRATRACSLYELGGLDTNLALLRGVLRSSELRDGAALTTTTSWQEAAEAPPARVLESLSQGDGAQGTSRDGAAARPGRGPATTQDAAGPGEVLSPLDGLLRWEVPANHEVVEGTVIAVILAMKMETPVKAASSGCVRHVAEDSSEVGRGQLLAVVEDLPQGEGDNGPEASRREAAEVAGAPPATGARWRAAVEERARRAAVALMLGGEEALASRREEGRLNVRERVNGLLDIGTFREVGPVAGPVDKAGRFSPANFILGTGRVDGRMIVVGGEDFTIQGGSPNLGGLQKSVFCERLALQLRIPLVRLHEGGGGAVAGGKRRSPATAGAGTPLRPAKTAGEPTRFGTVADCLGLLPVATAALGAVAGLPASRLVASHFVVAVRSAQILVAGPRVAENATGKRVSKEELGGEAVHSSSGTVDNYVDTESEAFEQIRRFLSYLPSNVDGLPPYKESLDPVERKEEELLTIVPEDRSPYDMRRLIELVVDRDTGVGTSAGASSSFFELGTSSFGREIITGLARLGGQPVGLFANDPRELGGAMTWQASVKTRRFIELCVTFHLPVVTLIDQPGFMVGLDAEKAGTIRFGTAAVLAAQTATVPWCSLQIRKAYGVAAAAHYAPDAHILLWPSAESGTLPVEAGVAVMYRRELDAAPPGERRQLQRRLVEEHSRALNPWSSIEGFGAHDLIDPRETRQRLCEWAELARLRLPGLAGPTKFPYRC